MTDMEKLLRQMPASDVVAWAIAEIDRLRDENAKIVEDRARFPDRPDSVGRAIECHYGNLHEKIRGLEEARKRSSAEASALRRAWIPVEERLPEISEASPKERVLAAIDGGRVHELTYSINIHARTARGRSPRWMWQGVICFWKVTHWMPLPKAPEESEA